MDKVPMTIEGYAALEEELQAPPAGRAPADHPAISEARSHGDLSENAEYHAAKEAQSLNEGRVAELESLICRAPRSSTSSKLSGTPDQVRRDGQADRRGHRGGEDLPDRRRARRPTCSSGKVSITSPIARALIGKKVGDTVEVNTPGGGKSYEIVGVAFV